MLRRTLSDYESKTERSENVTAKTTSNVLLFIFLTGIAIFSFDVRSFEVSGDTFEANFKITSWTARADSSTITSQGYQGDKYGMVYLTHNLEGRAGKTNQGNFTGHLRSVNNQGEAVVGSLQGVWKRDGKLLTLNTLDEFSNGVLWYAKGTIDLVEGSIKFIVHP